MKRAAAEAAIASEPPPRRTIEKMTSAIELGKLLGVSRQTIVREMDAGRLPYHRIGGCRRIAESDAEAYVASRRVGPPRKSS